MPKIQSFNINFDDYSLKNIARKILKNKKSFRIVFTVNVDHLRLYKKNPILKKYHTKSDLITCDSKILRMISPFFGNKITNVVTGSDLTNFLFKSKMIKKKKILVVGPTYKEVSILSKIVKLDINSYYPDMNFFKSKSKINRAINIISKSKPDIIFLGLGFPKQEIFANKLRKKISKNCICLCIGASLDFLSRKQVRAPYIFQFLAFEWLWRLTKNPIRLGPRYFKDFIFILLLFFNKLFGANYKH